MKLRYNIFYTIVEQLKPVEKVQMVLTAHMDMEDPLTKTYLAGDPVASSRYTYWLPTDEIGVLGLSLGKFTNTSADTSAVAVFEGESELSSQYYAIYPYPECRRRETDLQHSGSSEIPEKYFRDRCCSDGDKVQAG